MKRHPTKVGERALSTFSCLAVLLGATACAGLTSERVVYDREGVRIGTEADPSIARAKTDVRNAHPAQLTADDVRSLLGVVQVSGWSGTLAGIFENARPVPLLTDEQLKDFSGYVSDAFRQAEPTERILFSFPKPGVAYSEDRTEGALFVRDRYLHVVVNDHSSVLRADTGGGEAKDIRDTKGLKLWVAKPAQAATVPDHEEPRWTPFETVHISVNFKEVLALRSAAPPVRVGREGANPAPMSSEGGSSRQDLQNQVRELTNSNLDLRQRLDEQAKRMKDLTEEMNRLRLDLEQSKLGKQAPRRSPSP